MIRTEKDEFGIKVFLGKRLVGVVRDNRFICHVNKEHFVKKYPGFAKSVEVLDYIKKLGVKKIIFIYHRADNTDEIYESDIEDWERYGIRDALGKFEPQIFLRLEYMKKK